MDIEEKREKIAHMHKYFSNSFWVSFILLIIASILTIVLRDTQIAILSKYFQVEAKDWGWLVALIFGVWKILIIQFTLVPALILWGMKRCCFKGECKM